MNELRPRTAQAGGVECRTIADPERIRRAYAQYLQDESRMTAEGVEALHFPTSAEEAAAAVRAARRAGHRLAVSGGRTGITGAAVPLGAEEILSLEALKDTPVVRRNDAGGWVARVAAGTTLEELDDALTHGLYTYPDGKPEGPLFYPVDATEMTAQLGGTIATDASGARTFHYGPTRRRVEWLKVVTPDGRILELRRGEVQAEDGRLIYARQDGEQVTLDIPDLPMPDTKHTAGYYLNPDMDALDLFVGSEGTLGIIVEAELRLALRPADRLFLTQFLPGPYAAIGLVNRLTGESPLEPLALEYLGPRALGLLRGIGRQTPAYMEVARLPSDAEAAVYMEVPFENEAELDAIYAEIVALLNAEVLEPERSWAGFTEKDLQGTDRLGRAVPAAVNAIVGQRKAEVPELHKVGTDMAVPPEALAEMMDIYDSRLSDEGLEYATFGHIGDGHVHVNILPSTAGELARAEQIYADFAREAVRLGGSVAAEHGIGRIKKQFLPIQYSADHINAMRAIRRAIDPDATLNPGVLFDV